MTRPDKKIDRIRHPRTATNARGVSVSIRSALPVLMFLRARGHGVDALLAEQGVDSALLRDPEARIAHSAAIRLWHSAEELTNDPDLGLHVAEAIRPGQFGALEYALQTSSNLGAAYTRLSRYHRFLHDAAEVVLETDGQHAILSHRLPLPGGAPRPVSEFILAGWLVTSRRATGTGCTPLQVRFPHPQPENVSEHQRVFGCPVKFGCQRSELVFSRSLLDVPLLKADPVLQEIVEAQVVALIAKLPKGEATTDSVRRFLAEELPNGRAQLAHIAPRLRMSERTLHRKLDQEGATFRRILAEVRRELAIRHLIEGRLAVGEIAFLLGFSEVSAFHRAFRNWTGHTPRAYRNLHVPISRAVGNHC